jgi:hypothetical protein
MAFDFVGGVVNQSSEAKTELNNSPDASGWSEAMDAVLVQRRVEKKLPWRAVAPIEGMNARRCQSRLKVLIAREGRVVSPSTIGAAGEPGLADRDGIEWLQRKGKLTPRRQKAALHYREVFRAGDGLSMKSCLNVTVGGGGAEAVLCAVVGSASARVELRYIRHEVLRGQDDLLTVIDGVCGIGHTPRALAGPGTDDQVKRRAGVLEAVLMVALDLVARHLERLNRY